MKPSRALAVLGVLAVLLTACSKPTGTIKGHLYRVGGPAPGLPSPMSGWIYVSEGAMPLPALPDGSFSAAVPAGTYRLSGRSPLIEDGNGICHARQAVTVQVGASVQIDVICDIP